jgi:hypothetical protein
MLAKQTNNECNMPRKWTDEQRQQQSEAIQSRKPWEQSTGPRTTEGKVKVAQNAYRGGTRAQMAKINRILNQYGHTIDSIQGMSLEQFKKAVGK